MYSRAHFFAGLTVSGAFALGAAFDASAQGDGSGTNNADLLRGSVGVGCQPGTICHFPPGDLMGPAPSAVVLAPVSAPQPAYAVPASATPQTSVPVAPVPTTVLYAPDPVHEWDVAYALGISGAYVVSNGSEQTQLVLSPSLALSRQGNAQEFSLGAEAEFVASDGSESRFSSGTLDASFTHRLSPSAALSFDAALGISQDDATGLSVEDASVTSAPVTVTGDLALGYDQSFGPLSLGTELTYSRQWVGPTGLSSGAEIDNSDSGLTSYGSVLRLGYALSPVVEAFGSASIARDDYQAADPDLGGSRSSTQYALRAGLSAQWGNGLSAEVSAGSGWRDYDADSVADAQTWLYGAALAYAPNSTTQLRAAFDTALAAGSGSSGASTAYTLSLGIDHTVNPWLVLRANASAGWDVPADGSAVSRSYDAGVGADIVINPNASSVLDYSYGLREDPDADLSVRDEHRISAGLTLQY